jgi:hypothetical protein
LKISVKYKIGQNVVLKAEPDKVRTITGYLVRSNNGKNYFITYGVGGGTDETWQTEVELECANAKIVKVKGFKG